MTSWNHLGSGYRLFGLSAPFILGALAAGCGGGGGGGISGPPGQVMGLSAVIVRGELTLAWPPVLGARSYDVYAGSAPGLTPSPTHLVKAVTEASATIANAPSGALHYYAVRAVGDAGAGPLSVETGVVIPGVPSNLAVTATGLGLRLTWNAAAAATGYKVYAATAAGVPLDSGHVFGSFTTTSALHPGTPFGTAIYFVVTAIGDMGEGAPSIEVHGIAGIDPLFVHQWHLKNTGQLGGTPGEDARVVPAWDAGIQGVGTRIAVVDDGVEINHPDLAPNVVPGKSYNYLNRGTDPTGGEHGTCCAGVAAAAGSNGIGVRGAAPAAGIVGYNLLQAMTTANEADAMMRDAVSNWISTNSWGGVDGKGVPQPSSSTWKTAVVDGLSRGRNGLGTIYLWAAGNGGQNAIDDSNLDGQANFFGVMAIGAVGDDGKRASYSERGANLWVCAPSQGRNRHAITTTDRSGTEGYNDGKAPSDYPDLAYTNTFNGTSSATPLAAGVVALLLQANPGLGWSDVRVIIARSARASDPAHADWRRNGAGHLVNHDYGFGVINAQAAVELARAWAKLSPLQTSSTPVIQVNRPIPDNSSAGISSSINVTSSPIQTIEFVTVRVDAADHPYPADLEIVLRSPAGTESILARQHIYPQGVNPVAFREVTFGVARLLDERVLGTWTLIVRDLDKESTGTLRYWQLTVHGR